MVFSKERYAERRARKNAAKAEVEAPAEELVVETPEPQLPSLGVISAFLAKDPEGNEGAYRTALHAYKSYEEGQYDFEKAKALIDEALGLGEPAVEAEQPEEEPNAEAEEIVAEEEASEAEDAEKEETPTGA